MIRFLKLATAAVLVASPCNFLSSQETEARFASEFHLGVMLDTGNDMKAMRDSTAWSASLAMPVEITEGLYIRPYLSSVLFDGVEGSGLTAKRPHFMGGVDLKTGISGSFSVFGGLFGMKWNQAATADDPRFIGNGASTVIGSELGAGIKLGGRFGVDYQINEKFIVQMYWTVAEANKRFSPSWITVGGAIRF